MRQLRFFVFLIFLIPSILIAENLALAEKVKAYPFCEGLSEWHDDFMPGDELENFWSHHPRFGFFKQNGRLYLITRNTKEGKELNLKLQADLSNWSYASGFTTIGTANSASIEQITDAIIFDVTDITPPLGKAITLRDARANCWGYACFSTRLVHSISSMDEGEFSFLLKSPLVRKLAPGEQRQAGDLVAYRNYKKTGAFNKELHGAMYISDDIFLSKTEGGDSFLRIQDSKEVTYYYLDFAPKTMGLKTPAKIEIFRPLGIKAFMEKNASQIGSKLKTAVDELNDLEEASILKNVQEEHDAPPLSDEDNEKYREALKKLMNASARLFKLADSEAPNSKNEIEKFLWDYIRHRTNALGHLGKRI